MRTGGARIAGTSFVALLCMLLSVLSATGQDDVADFESDSWVLRNAEVVDRLGRKCLMGFGILKDVEFENGIIEVDVAVDGTRSYPGIVFRVQSERDYERFYIRPHRAGLYPDALQYTPVFNGIEGWQLYSGEGYTAEASIPTNEWIRLRMEIQGRQARVFINNSSKPALLIDDLKHGESKGAIGVLGPRDGTAFFSNFRYRTDVSLEFEPPPPVDTPPGMISEWQLSERYQISQIEEDTYPGEEELASITWQELTSESSGLVDIARYSGRGGREPDCVFARTVISSNKKQVRKFLFGYSDQISVFLNGRLLFFGSSLYQERDPSFLGIVSLSDAVYLPLEAGENELLLMITETFGGWGFKCRDATAVFHHESVKGVWQTEEEFLLPESVAYDSKRDVLYVSNFDAYNKSSRDEGQFISRISLDGNIEDLKWITGLSNPTGLAVFEDKLFVVERRSLAEIDIESGQVQQRYQLPDAILPNDVTVDQSGIAYVSDSRKNVIYRLADGKVEEWLSGDEIDRPNGLHAHNGTLVVGNNGDRSLKSVDIGSKNIMTIARLGTGIIDGIKTDQNGNYVVSHSEGRVYRISPSGQIVKLLDTSAPELYSADFEYIAGKALLIVPTLLDNRVMAYRLNE